MKSKLTKKLEQIIYHQFDKRKEFCCPEVTIDWYGRERVDYMVYTTSREFLCYEIKVSKSDFYSNSRLTFVGNRNYFVMTEELWDQVKGDIPGYIGVYIAPEEAILNYEPMSNKNIPYKFLKCVKRCKFVKNLHWDREILLGSMIRNMSREINKTK